MVDVVDARTTVASPSAACGGCSEGAASAAVGEGRSRSVGKDIRRITANVGDIKLPKAATLEKGRQQ